MLVGDRIVSFSDLTCPACKQQARWFAMLSVTLAACKCECGCEFEREGKDG